MINEKACEPDYMFPQGKTYGFPWWVGLWVKLFGKKIHHFSVDGELCGYYYQGKLYITSWKPRDFGKIRGYEKTCEFHDEAYAMPMTTVYEEGEPCKHPGCLNHVTHPCEGCGRVAGQGVINLPTHLVNTWKAENGQDEKAS